MSILGKIRALVAEIGAIGAGAYVLHRGLASIGGGFYLYHFVAQPVSTGPLLTKGRGQSITVHQVDLNRGWQLGDLPLTPEVVSYRQKQGSVCLCAFKEGHIFGCLWLCLGPYQEDEVRCLMVPAPRGEVSWDFDVYVRPERRLGPTFARLWEVANQYLGQQGIGWSVSRISAANRRSLGAHARLGAQRIGSAIFLRLGRMQLMISSLWPFAHISLGPTSTPTLVLQVPHRGQET